MPFIITNEKIIIVLCFQEISQTPKLQVINSTCNGEQLRRGQAKGQARDFIIFHRALAQGPGQKGEKQKRKAFKLEQDEVTALHRPQDVRCRKPPDSTKLMELIKKI